MSFQILFDDNSWADVAGIQDNATMCYMETVTHREMRNNSGEILRRVGRGESLIVSNNGRPAAMIVPVGETGSALEELIARGQARPALISVASLASVIPSPSGRTTREIIEDTRGSW